MTPCRRAGGSGARGGTQGLPIPRCDPPSAHTRRLTPNLPLSTNPPNLPPVAAGAALGASAYAALAVALPHDATEAGSVSAVAARVAAAAAASAAPCAKAMLACSL